MQLVIIVSTCRGCDRQTQHPHIQLQVRRQEELSSRVQTSQQAWTLSLPSLGPTLLTIQVWILLLKREKTPLAHASSKPGERPHDVVEKQNEIFRVPDFNPTHELMDTWNEGKMNEWNPHLYKSVWSPSVDLWLVPPWTLQHLREVVG